MTKRIALLRGLAMAASAGTLLIAAGCASRPPEDSALRPARSERTVSELDHGAIAAEYERQAAIDAATAKRHFGYAITYRRNRTPASGVEVHETLARHCENLARTYEQAANENLHIAGIHRQLARTAN
ncbi:MULTISPECIES: hypothetical protein [unclassified Variovorax]|uniref:hypothetical protein n=1 Tax=unclassified Variovorax TaxID=663243 RepID=UPI0011AF22CC|nr:MULTISPECIES: hypothetical protein [unclassified Variovorax]